MIFVLVLTETCVSLIVLQLLYKKFVLNYSIKTLKQPDRPDELSRIEAAGGRVIYWDGPRVLGVLAMSRAIGTYILVGILYFHVCQYITVESRICTSLYIPFTYLYQLIVRAMH